MVSDLIEVCFNAKEKAFLASVFSEIFDGGSTEAIQNVLGPHVDAVTAIRPIIVGYAKSQSESISMTEPQWRVMYEAIHAVIYGLGPTELETCTGNHLHEVCNLNLRICAKVWGVFQGDYRW